MEEHKLIKEPSPSNTSLEERLGHIQKYSTFCLFTPESLFQLATLIEEMHVEPDNVIVQEGDYFDGFYLIVSGQASVSRSLKRIRKTNPRHIITLGPDHAIGIGEAGFPSKHGVRTATVTARSHMLLLKMDLLNFYYFLKEHGAAYPSLKNMSEKFLLLHLIKQTHFINSLPAHQINDLIAIAKEDLEPPINNKSDISNQEQMIFQQINDKHNLKRISKSELKELDTDEMHLIMRKLKKLGVVDFDLIMNHTTSESTPAFQTLLRKIAHYWKGTNSREQSE